MENFSYSVRGNKFNKVYERPYLDRTLLLLHCYPIWTLQWLQLFNELKNPMNKENYLFADLQIQNKNL
jgi:hypothetical protein